MSSKTMITRRQRLIKEETAVIFLQKGMIYLDTTKDNYFQELYAVDVSEKVREKNGLTYLSWAAAWAEVKKRYPEATYRVYENPEGRFWFDDGRTGWVKTGVVINDIEHIERLPVLDFKNKSIPADNITSYDANRAVQRSLTKACGRHGLGLYIYEGEDLPESAAALIEMNEKNYRIVSKLSKEMPDAKAELLDLVGKYCSNANPKLIKDINDAVELNKELVKFVATRKKGA